MSSRIIVTGGNAGLGYFTVELLARTGASITIAARNLQRAQQAAESVRAQVPGADIDIVRLDLADLSSVRDAAAQLAARPLDGIVLNAGVLPWDRAAGATVDGFDPVFGTNQLGHFALLAQVFGALTPTAGVVTLGSIAHRGKRLQLDKVAGARQGTIRGAYGHSKLAVMTTAIELDRRIRAAGLAIRSTIAQPGFASDANGPQRPGITERATWPYALAIRRLANTKEQGAAISVHALRNGLGGQCYGPDGRIFGLRGAPKVDQLAGPVLDPEAGRRLWALSEELTGVEFSVLTT